ncbi:hypothetical protein [Pectobacterium zantedeschiae]|uniref:Uncharacterized protein n=1 Tax=Pectobacterium zantedeschiae TaxID=2034769 RepID=A0A9X8P595_9GAMM|nr:hypothetical protein [Pectobacterium zantedeschiae]RYC44199.1 hypothetical protein CLR69_03915 [Pectobacterium zantedeschiae]RYC48580.1 hypothetical protein CTN06_03710 [Pectobacterium zantedeschiae]
MKENELQTAIMSSLQDYCSRNEINYQHMSFYNNQQGDTLNKVCADFVFTLSCCHFYMAEVKVLDSSGELNSWDDEQFIANCYFEKYGFPINYFYNEASVSYFSRPQPKNYGELVMEEIKMSKPSLLKSKRPLVSDHMYIKNLFNTHGATGERNIGGILTALGENYLKTNGMIAIAYGDNGMLYADILTPEIAMAISETLRKYAKNKNITNNLKVIINEYFSGGNDLIQAMNDPQRKFPINFPPKNRKDNNKKHHGRGSRGPKISF